MDTKVTDFESIVLKLASPERILSWSHGEVTKPETINYRTQRPERNGLFCERIFGPEKDFECYCGKYKRIRYKGIVCEKCGVEVTNSIVRRERMGHIALAAPVSHIWFLKGAPSRIGMLLDIKSTDLDKVIYFAGYIITKVIDGEKAAAYKALDVEYKGKLKDVQTKEEKDALKSSMLKAKSELDSLVLYRVLTELEYYNLSMKYGEIFEAETGAEAIYNIFRSIDLDDFRKKLEPQLQAATGQDKLKYVARINLLKSMKSAAIRPEWMFLTTLPVIPPSLRPMVALDGGRHATSDLNDLYRRVINRNNRLKKLVEIKAPEVICRNEKRILQEAVDALIDNTMRKGQNLAMAQGQRRPLKSLAEMLKGKPGRFRQNLLGKRVDYSGRSVIVVGPDLKMSQCGLPKHMALELFRPFVIAELIKREIAYNIRGAGKLIDEKIPEVWAILEEIIKDKRVLLNRAPSLHRLSIQAFQPVLIEGNAIQLHPMVCHAFNADFDGDQMAVHVPLGEEAQAEARDIIASVKNLLKPGSGDPVVDPSQDMVLGCYWLTGVKEGAQGEGNYYSDPADAILANDFGKTDIRAKIKIQSNEATKYKGEGGFLETTVGRLLFNGILPEDFPYINEELGKKALSKLVAQLIEKYGIDATPDILDKIKEFGFKYATASGISWGYQDVRIPVKKGEILAQAEKEANEIKNQYQEGLLTDSERYNKVIEIWQGAKNKIEELVPGAIDKMGPIYAMISSAARGTLSQLAQMTGMKGLMVNPAGKIIDFPVRSSYKEGLGILEYFITTHGARKGEADTALKTSKAGYLTRRLIDVSHDVVIGEEDCGEKEGITISRKRVESYGKKFSARIFGRTLVSSAGTLKKGHLLSVTDAKRLEADPEIEEVKIFSPITCQAKRGICKKCYGYDLGTNKEINIGEAVGIVAAQAVGEPGTQLTMKTFHKGGIAVGGDITMGLPRIEEIFELRNPKNPAVVCDVDGEIIDIESVTEGPEAKTADKVITVLIERETAKGKEESKKFYIPFARFITVKKGDKIKQGDVLTDGSLNIKEYFAIAGKDKTQEYILKEVDKVYAMQGATINEKHIEVIIRQMFSRFKVLDVGETDLNLGELADARKITEANEKAEQDGKPSATVEQIVMPIAKVALSTASFLSAASFQDTARVLIKTAVVGGEDKLRGLKENVIVGRLIPAGTGFRREYVKEEEVIESESKGE
ncbi:DNA-directed RNA polymerase subunit beta' [Candidatus Parcubacteria bacterium]|nr:MAG: DNA-directed RNA polymerase subunit beta' [Candidatus Parcubacteria bacterium]